MAMQMQEYGHRTPKMTRILITGGMLSGKTTLAAKFSDNPERVVFVSTDGNALSQGYRGIRFEFPNSADQMMSKITECMNLLRANQNSFDVIVWDLIEDIDEVSQTLLRPELENPKKSLKAWGKISGMYKDLQTLLRSNFEDKTVILLSRENRNDIKNKWGDVVKTEYTAVLRDTLKNQVLKDVDASVRVFIDDQGQHKAEVESYRFPEVAQQIGQIVNKPLPTFKKQLTFQDRLDQTIAKAEAKASGITGKEEKIPQHLMDEMWKSNDMDKVNNLIKVWAEEQITKAKGEQGE